MSDGRSDNKLFSPVKYYLPETFSQERRLQLRQALDTNGGRNTSINSCTHIITNSARFQGWQNVTKTVKVVSVLPGDLVAMEAGIKALGGQWRHGLTRDVTHLFATSPDSDKYAAAVKHRESTLLKILLPHWFDDVVRFGCRNLLTGPYEWPNPKALEKQPSEEAMKAERGLWRSSSEKRNYFKTVEWKTGDDPMLPIPDDRQHEDIWSGRQVLLSHDLELSDQQRIVVEDAIKNTRGVIMACSSTGSERDEEEHKLVSKCDVFVSQWRSGSAFFRAVEDGKIVGTLNWIFFVISTGTLTSPMDRFLHFPTRKTPLAEDFSKQVITITNFTGETRDYLKRLILSMGAKFTPNMGPINTLIVAAHLGGQKAARALSWSLPLVNQLWLEDCFAQWKYISPSIHKYIDFPPNVDFARMLGERGTLDSMEDLEKEEEDDILARSKPASVRSASERKPLGTESSIKEVQALLSAQSRKLSDPRVVSASVSPSKAKPDNESLKRKASTFDKVANKVREEEDEPAPPPKKRVKADKVTFDDVAAKKPIGSKRKNVVTPVEKPTKASSSTLNDVPAPKVDSVTHTSPKAGHGDQKLNKSGQPLELAPILAAPGPRTSSNTTRRTKQAQPDEGESEVESKGDTDVEMLPPSTSKGKGKAANTSKSKKLDKGKDKDKDIGTPAVKEKGKSSSVSSKKSKKSEETNEDVEMPPPKARNKVIKPKEPKQMRSKFQVVWGCLPEYLISVQSSSARKSVTTVRIATTQVILSDAVNKASSTTNVPAKPDHWEQNLEKLGVKLTQKTSECTHLIAKGFVRTEKLMCALAAGAYIVSEKWATDSIAADKLLPEEKYLIKDKDGEAKWGVKLIDAMDRAKELDGKLFENHIFYVTPKTAVDTKLLKTIVTAQGGKLNVQNPTIRILKGSENKFVISCPEDISIWRSLASDYPIYSHELLLNSTLAQRIDWDNPAYRIAGPA
ncbi:unnamed protein product [Mycena citricolor]|uniref:BRCT domain-containing protein n=1 Tax=Mycena citricolor TaxID=2018698 RepID=A0AAD2HTI2_9AGAR|nr:unnamed protein product [Mycena citricolor]